MTLWSVKLKSRHLHAFVFFPSLSNSSKVQQNKQTMHQSDDMQCNDTEKKAHHVSTSLIRASESFTVTHGKGMSGHEIVLVFNDGGDVRLSLEWPVTDCLAFEMDLLINHLDSEKKKNKSIRAISQQGEKCQH